MTATQKLAIAAVVLVVLAVLASNGEPHSTDGCDSCKRTIPGLPIGASYVPRTGGESRARSSCDGCATAMARAHAATHGVV